MFNFSINENNKFDIDLEKNENELESSVLLSLFSNQLVEKDEAGTDDNIGGWWGDLANQETTIKRLGSKIHLMARDKIESETPAKLKGYIESSLQWLVEDGIAVNLVVDVEQVTKTALASTVIIEKPKGKKAKFDFVWQF